MWRQICFMFRQGVLFTVIGCTRCCRPVVGCEVVDNPLISWMIVKIATFHLGTVAFPNYRHYCWRIIGIIQITKVMVTSWILMNQQPHQRPRSFSSTPPLQSIHIHDSRVWQHWWQDLSIDIDGSSNGWCGQAKTVGASFQWFASWSICTLRAVALKMISVMEWKPFDELSVVVWCQKFSSIIAEQPLSCFTRQYHLFHPYIWSVILYDDAYSAIHKCSTQKWKGLIKV